MPPYSTIHHTTGMCHLTVQYTIEQGCATLQYNTSYNRDVPPYSTIHHTTGLCHLTVQYIIQQGCAILQYSTLYNRDVPPYITIHHTCDRQLSALNMSKNTKQVKVIVVSLGVIILSLIWNKKMITNVKPTVFQQTKTQQFFSNHGVTSLKNTPVKKTNALWYKWHLLSLTEDNNQFCTKQTHNNMRDLWLPQQCCWRISSSGMLWCVVGLQFLAFQRIILPWTSVSCSVRNEVVSDLAVHIYRQGH